MTTRGETIQGLRQLADWLTLNPDAPYPIGQRILIALHTNDKVHEFAEWLGTDVAVDKEGNCSTTLRFGGLAYHAYGYTDFAAHIEAADARDAQRYAERHNLILTPKTQENAA